MWQDVADGIIEAGDPALAEIGAALRVRDYANAAKPVPFAYIGATGTSVTSTSTWTTSLTLHTYVPHDAPDGWMLWIPVQIVVASGSGYPTVLARLTVGGVATGYGARVGGSGVTADVLMGVPITAAMRNTEIEIDVEIKSVTGDAGTANSATRYQAARMSIREN